MAYQPNKILSSYKKERGTDKSSHINKVCKYYSKLNKSWVTKDQISYCSIFIKCPENVNPERQKAD